MMDIRKIVPAVFTVVGAILKVVFDIQIDKEKLDDRMSAYDNYMINTTMKRLDKIERKLTGNEPEEVVQEITQEEAPE